MILDPRNITLVAFGIAFVAGLASFLSPCVLPLVPAYIGYLSGATFAGGEIRPDSRRTTVTHAVAFVVGFSALFILIGAAFGLVAWLVQSLTGGGSAAAAPGAAQQVTSAVRATDNLIEILKNVLLRVGVVMLAVMASRVADNPLSGEWRVKLGGFVLVWPDPIARVPQRYVRWALVGLLTAATYLWLTNKPLSPHNYVDALLLGVLPLAGAGLSAAGAVVLGVLAALLNSWSVRVGVLWTGSTVDVATVAVEAILIVVVVYFLSRTMLFYQEKRFEVSGRLQGRGYVTSGVMGAVFGAGWTPCTGPNLALILALAATAGSAGIGTALLVTYALGLGVPFILVGFAFGSAAAGLRRVTPYMGLIKTVNMLLLLFTAALLLSGRLQGLAQFGSIFRIDL